MAFNNFKAKKFTQVTSSISNAKEIYRKIPAVLRSGKKSQEIGGKNGFFDYKRIVSASDKSKGADFYDDDAVIVQQDPTTLETGVYISSSIFRAMMNEYLQFTVGLPSSSYQQISASFFSQIGNGLDNMPSDEQYVGILAAPFEEGSVGAESEIIQPVTASVKVIEAPGIAFNEAGALRQRKITYINSSSNFTNSHFFFNFNTLTSTTTKFGNTQQSASTAALVAKNRSHRTRSLASHTNVAATEQFYYVQPEPILKFSVEMTSSNTTASFFAMTSSFSGAADFGVLSGSFIGRTIESSSTAPRFYNGTNPAGTGDSTDGQYLFVVQKGIVEGEGEFAKGETSYAGDTGTNVAFTPQQLVVWYPPEYTYNNVRSASFHFTPYPENMVKLNTGAKTKDLVTGSISSSEALGTGELRTVYWLNHTFTSSFTGSFGNFTKDQLRTQTGGAGSHQLPYMNTSIRKFGKKNSNANSSHLWKDSALSIPVDQGYYVHSSSFTQESKNQMSASFGNANHTSSFFVFGAFIHPFVSAIDGTIMNYSASQLGEAGVNNSSFMSHHPIASCVFLKRFDDEVFIFHPESSGLSTSESVG